MLNICPGQHGFEDATGVRPVSLGILHLVEGVIIFEVVFDH
jgi:hypothetical protein